MAGGNEEVVTDHYGYLNDGYGSILSKNSKYGEFIFDLSDFNI